MSPGPLSLLQPRIHFKQKVWLHGKTQGSVNASVHIQHSVMSSILSTPLPLLDPRERFKVEVFLVIIDSLIAALNERLSAYQACVSNMFGFLRRLRDISPTEVVTTAEVLVMKYPEVLERYLSVELVSVHYVY